MKQWKRWIREDLKGLGLFLVLAGGLLYAILFWFGYHLTYDNTILPGGNFWLVGGEILLTGIVAAAVLAVLFRALSGGFCRTETPTVMPENKCTSTSAPTADAAEYDHEKDGQTATGNERKKEKSGIWRTRYASFIEKKYAFFVLWAVIFLLWIPFWLSSYPGIFSYDSNLQFNWYFTDYRSAHHPLVHTWMLGGLVDLGHTLFGSYQAGAVLYALTQMVIMSALFAGICLYLGRKKAPLWLFAASVIFYGIYPANAYLCMTATKDSIFSALFGFYMAQLLAAGLDPDGFFRSKKQLAELIITCFLMMILRNNTMYMILIGAPFFLIWYRKHWKGALVAVAVPLLLLKIYTGPVYDALGVERVDAREAYNAIIQTISRTYNLAPEDFTEEEKELLFEVIPEDYIVRYVPHKGDEVRWGFDTAAFNEHKAEIFKLWIEKGLSHPLMYLDGFFSTNFGLWYPWDILPDDTTIRMYVEYFFGTETQEILGIHFDPKLPLFHQISYAICQDSVLTRIPVIGGILFGAGTFIWIVLFASLYLIWTKKWGPVFIILIPMWAYFLTLLFGPVSCMRYMYPYMTSLPIILYLLSRAGDNWASMASTAASEA